MAGFLARRLLSSVLLVAVAASLAYLLAAGALDPRSNYADRTPKPPPAVVDARLTELNLNDRTPLLQRYLTWAGGVLHGDFGKSVTGTPVNEDLARRAGVTFRLVTARADLRQRARRALRRATRRSGSTAGSTGCRPARVLRACSRCPWWCWPTC